MKTHELETREAAGNRDPLNRRYYIDGKRVQQDEFLAIEQVARNSGQLEHLSSANVNGELRLYSVARV